MFNLTQYQSSIYLKILLLGAFIISASYTKLVFAGDVVVKGATEAKAKYWLERMSRAYKELNYDGVLTYWHENGVRTLRVVHIVDNGVEYEHFIQLDGDERELLKNGDKVVLMQSGTELVSMDKGLSSSNRFASKSLADDLIRLQDFYDFVLGKSGRVAQRKSIGVLINPRDEFRYGYRLWLDEATGLLLKSEMVDHDKKVLEGFQFSQVVVGDEVTTQLKNLKIPAVSEDKLETKQLVETRKPVVKLQRLTPVVGPDPSLKWNWTLNWLPAGFSLAADEKEQTDLSQTMVARMYTDGLAVFTIFIEQLKKNVSINSSKPTRMGPTVVMTKQMTLVDGQESDHYVTFMGEVPIKTAKQITNSITATRAKPASSSTKKLTK